MLASNTQLALLLIVDDSGVLTAQSQILCFESDLAHFS